MARFERMSPNSSFRRSTGCGLGLIAFAAIIIVVTLYHVRPDR